MFFNEDGEAIENNRAIFPIITLNKGGDGIKCLGTGFFINPMGWFVTARHVVVDKNGGVIPDLMVSQSYQDGTTANRFINMLCLDDKTDIAVGTLEFNAYAGSKAVPVQIEAAPFLGMSFKKVNVGDDINSYGYPKTTKTYPEENKESFHFTGTWSSGKLIEFHKDGVGLLKNMRFQTTMKIEDGASGGPVFKDDWVIGINSTGYDLEEGEVPISFITPIHYLQNYNLELEGQVIPLKELIEKNYLRTIK